MKAGWEISNTAKSSHVVRAGLKEDTEARLIECTRIRTAVDFASGDVRIAYLASEDLIALKEGSWREKDQLDVNALRRILEKETLPASGSEAGS